MKRVVIGAAFGDEGKGNLTDILCSEKPNTINVRFNGGAQASHTVVTPDGKRNAFRHFGSGTFAGATTYLSESFIVNPFAFVLEKDNLKKQFQISPKVYVNPNCSVTTLWDMYINQAIETIRAEGRHGSCGFGINETVHRSKYSVSRIIVKDLLNETSLMNKLKFIQDEYVPLRLRQKYSLEINQLPSEYVKLLTDEDNICKSIYFSGEFLKGVKFMEDNMLDVFENIVFEGAQGLLLDQGNKKFWPNVTTSNTGIQNVMSILDNLQNSDDLEIYYLSRCYTTRHGRGKFPTETNFKPYKGIVDLTNIPNDFQETLRFGYIDLDLITEAINKDLNYLKFPAKIYVVLTCFDQIDSTVKYKVDDRLEEISKEQFLPRILAILRQKLNRFSGMYITKGETRNNLRQIKETT